LKVTDLRRYGIRGAFLKKDASHFRQVKKNMGELPGHETGRNGRAGTTGTNRPRGRRSPRRVVSVTFFPNKQRPRSKGSSEGRGGRATRADSLQQHWWFPQTVPEFKAKAFTTITANHRQRKGKIRFFLFFFQAYLSDKLSENIPTC